MNFEEVLPHLREGKKAKRRGWRDGTTHVAREGNELYLYPGGAAFESLYANVTQNDWEIVEEKHELTWEEIRQAIFKWTLDSPNFPQIKKSLGFTE